MYSKVLTDEQIKKIHKASLNILESVGTIVPHKEVLQRFADKGAKVDFNTQNVKIPADLVMKLLSQAGKKFTLYGRDITKKAEFGYGKRNYNSIAGEAHWIDEIGKQRRFATLNDVAIANRFCDAIDLINICGAMTDPQEIPIEYRVVEVVYQQIKNTTKPIAFWFNDRASAKYVIDMLIALRGSVEKAIEMPMYYILFEPISPLKFPFEGIDYLFETSKVNLPITVGPMAQIGLTAPCSIAGTMCLENADILAGICVTQLVKPGMPICYGGICHSFDMSTTQMVFCGPEQAIFGVGMTQLAKYYGFPVFINVGLTDSKCVDGQAGLEIGTTLVLGA
jgi:trimethylamine--corrinoid protein Co-methyltransferase